MFAMMILFYQESSVICTVLTQNCEWLPHCREAFCFGLGLFYGVAKDFLVPVGPQLTRLKRAEIYTLVGMFSLYGFY
jgi:hypothetical protein